MIKVILAATAALILMSGAIAQQKPGTIAASPARALNALDKIVLADLLNADAIAVAQGNDINHQCWTALIDIIKKKQATPATPLPTIHLITDFQNLSDFANALQPTSKLSVACAPMANAVKVSVLQLITGIATGQLMGLVPIPGL
jgi:hypothetical protein